MPTPNSPDQIRIVPANEASWEDLRAIFSSGDARRCLCQFFKLTNDEWRALGVEGRADRLREETRCGDSRAPSTSGLVAYWDGEPAGWCAVEPRAAYPRLMTMRVPWAGRAEDKDDGGVWAVTCFVVRRGYRRRGIATALAGAAVDFARERGARAVEGYPKITGPADAGRVDAASLYVGSRNLFAAAGFREVSRPTPRRAVMRVDV